MVGCGGGMDVPGGGRADGIGGMRRGRAGGGYREDHHASGRSGNGVGVVSAGDLHEVQIMHLLDTQ